MIVLLMERVVYLVVCVAGSIHLRQLTPRRFVPFECQIPIMVAEATTITMMVLIGCLTYLTLRRHHRPLQLNSTDVPPITF